MKNRLTISIFLIVIILSLSGCNGNKQAELKIIIGNTNVNYKVLKDETSADLFKFAFGEADKYIEYVDIGEKVFLDFGDNPPDQIIINDHLLNSQGDPMYTEKEIFDVPVIGDNKRYYFVVNKNLASGLSSHYEENKKDFRGFTVFATKGEINKVYLFVIKTDGLF